MNPQYDITVAHEGGDTLVEHVERLADFDVLELVRSGAVVAVVITPEAHRQLLAAAIVDAEIIE